LKTDQRFQTSNSLHHKHQFLLNFLNYWN